MSSLFCWGEGNVLGFRPKTMKMFLSTQILAVKWKMESKFGGGPSKRARTQTKTVWPPQDHRNGSRKYVHLLIIKSWCFESTYYQLSKKRSKMIRCSHVVILSYNNSSVKIDIHNVDSTSQYKQIAKWPHIHISIKPQSFDHSCC